MREFKAVSLSLSAFFIQAEVISAKLQVEAENRAYKVLVVHEVGDLELRYFFLSCIDASVWRFLELFGLFSLSFGKLCSKNWVLSPRSIFGLLYPGRSSWCLLAA